jgi:hypothetical protein
MGRIIINNKSELPDTVAMDLVMRVMKAGRISNNDKQYCYLTTFHLDSVQYDVATDLRKESDSFVVYYSPYNKTVKQ